MHLLDLAAELVTLVFEHVGGVQLRASVETILISKRWYQLAHPVYVNHGHESTLCLSSHGLKRLPPLNSALSHAMQAKTKRLSIRLIGHPSRQIARDPWHQNPEESEHGNDDEEDKAWDNWQTAGPVIEGKSRNQQVCLWRREEYTHLKWRKLINKRLIDLANMLPAFHQLEELSFEASSECEVTEGPRWDWLFKSTMETLIKSIPVGLKYLRLDTAGSTIVTSIRDRTPLHICPLIAKRLHDFQHIRLRMRHICPNGLDIESQRVATSKLETLVIRLSIPFFPPATYESQDGHIEFDALPCDGPNSDRMRFHGALHTRVITAGLKFATLYPRLEKLRVSYRGSDINLMLADCVKRQYMYVGAEVFSYEDDGREWSGWEDDDEYLVVHRSF